MKSNSNLVNGKFSNLGFYPLAFSTGCITKFDLKTYSPGFVLRFPGSKDFKLDKDMEKSSKLFNVYQESKEWGKILGVNNAGRFNQVINDLIAQKGTKKLNQ